MSTAFPEHTTEPSPSLLRFIEIIHLVVHGIITTITVASIVALNTECIV